MSVQDEILTELRGLRGEIGGPTGLRVQLTEMRGELRQLRDDVDEMRSDSQSPPPAPIRPPWLPEPPSALTMGKWGTGLAALITPTIVMVLAYYGLAPSDAAEPARVEQHAPAGPSTQPVPPQE